MQFLFFIFENQKKNLIQSAKEETKRKSDGKVEIRCYALSLCFFNDVNIVAATT